MSNLFLSCSSDWTVRLWNEEQVRIHTIFPPKHHIYTHSQSHWVDTLVANFSLTKEKDEQHFQGQ